MTIPIGVSVVNDDYMRKCGCVHVCLCACMYACLYDPRVHVRFLHYYLHRKLQLAFSIPDLVYDVVVFFLLFHRFSVVVGCGIWLSYFMIITFYRHRRVFALTFQKFRANVHVTMKFHIQYN